jgi:hypothetical protein
MKPGDKVCFIGDVEFYLRDLPERVYLEDYFGNHNIFEITEIDKDRIEIFAKISDTHHFFYVTESEIKALNERDIGSKKDKE